ncbi:unnamed protein product [Boreogadus saida]
MLEHSSELALVQSLYVNSMRCPPSAAGVSVGDEDLAVRGRVSLDRGSLLIVCLHRGVVLIMTSSYDLDFHLAESRLMSSGETIRAGAAGLDAAPPFTTRRYAHGHCNNFNPLQHHHRTPLIVHH